jgi:hypothetical protein
MFKVGDKVKFVAITGSMSQILVDVGQLKIGDVVTVHSVDAYDDGYTSIMVAEHMRLISSKSFVLADSAPELKLYVFRGIIEYGIEQFTAFAQSYGEAVSYLEAHDPGHVSVFENRKDATAAPEKRGVQVFYLDKVVDLVPGAQTYIRYIE